MDVGIYRCMLVSLRYYYWVCHTEVIVFRVYSILDGSIMLGVKFYTKSACIYLLLICI